MGVCIRTSYVLFYKDRMNKKGIRSVTSMLHCRMSLVNVGAFASPAHKTLAELLLLAYHEFRLWCRSMRVACSQRPFTPKLVIKKVHGHYMSCKAYNGRVVLSWLAQKSSEIVASGCTDRKVLLQTAALTPGSKHAL